MYGIVPSDRCWRPDGFAGVHGAPVRVLEREGLAALVSDVEGEVPGRRRELLAHTSVLEQALERSPIVPAQFGTVAPDDAAVLDDLLTRRQQQLGDLLHEIDGLVEVRLSGIYDEEAVLAEVLRRNPALRTAGASVNRIELGQRVVEAIEAQRQADVRALVDALAPRARRHLEQPARGELGAVDLAFLLHREDLEAFDQAVTTSSQPLAQRVQLRYVGPLPPASFIALDAA